MPLFREDNYFIIVLGSLNTVVQFGLEDPFRPPKYLIPSIIYQHKLKKSYHINIKSVSPKNLENDYSKISFIQHGQIVNINAFNQFIRLIYYSALKKFISADRLAINDYSIPLLIINSSTKDFNNNYNLQRITNFVFNNLKNCNFFCFLSNASSLLFAYGNNLSSALIVDIGYEKLNIVPIIDFQIIKFSKLEINIGSNLINSKLEKLLPNLSASQIEDLKKSSVYEILSIDDQEIYDKIHNRNLKSLKNLNGLNKDNEEDDDDQLDVLSIINSTKNPKEILNERQKKKKLKSSSNKNNNNNSQPLKNSNLVENTFIDSNGDSFKIGPERFKGSKELILIVANSIYNVINNLPHKPSIKQDLWNNIIINGKVFQIKGFKDNLFNYLNEKFLVKPTSENDNQPPLSLITHNSDDLLSSKYNLFQTPTSIKFLKNLDYFSEWKTLNQNSNDLTLLGGQIFMKLMVSNNTSLINNSNVSIPQPIFYSNLNLNLNLNNPNYTNYGYGYNLNANSGINLNQISLSNSNSNSNLNINSNLNQNFNNIINIDDELSDEIFNNGIDNDYLMITRNDFNKFGPNLFNKS
ncbi:Arp9p ASCRUDRAFT_128369 [Ascoidea rubescens DSM 1968]|uniref:Actin-like ATPase domain-containing protein n=1 Tax=Ascoidea rubescens DSM 1968 TaxID=1344418 RepID=A0A1D2V936_9ASCO|nr:hypothetical protein ASCRUDRAFT_128369 [Ascoidea rubescens DSM 1968]ODV58172.1 hypothetical protein ASCRUDRAFT_128369 [Ascoidea rubescens DSM 1968]